MSERHAVQSLLRWLRTFEAARLVKSVSDISDGVVLWKVLQTISPKYFSQKWFHEHGTQQPLTPTDKLKNLERISQSIEEFLSQVPDESIIVRPLPHLAAIVDRNSADDVFRLLQLVLACAVNCEDKGTYIEVILNMEESDQQVLMEAIQQLMSSSRMSASIEAVQDSGTGHLLSAADECKQLLFERDALTQRCRELETLVSTLQNENANLQQEVDRVVHKQIAVDTAEHELLLASSESGLVGSAAKMPMSPTVASVRIGQLQDQLTKLRNELYRVESEKEDLKVKLADCQTASDLLREKCEVLSRKSEEAIHLKDELDIAREELAVASNLAATVDQLRRRADEAVELRVRCAKLETDNKVLVDRLAELEQETRLSGNLRSQAENQRQQAADARQAATQANARADSMEVELRRLREELAATSREKQRLVNELNRLRSCCEQLQRCAPPAHDINEEIQSLDSDINGLVYSSAMQSQMLNLREELSRLRTSFSSLDTAATADEEHDPAAASVENGHPNNLSTTEVVQDERLPVSDGTSSPPQVSIAKSDYADDTLIASLREQLSEKDRSFEQMEQQYRGYLWKARGLVRSLQRQLRTQNEATVSSGEESSDVAKLRSLLVEKERIIENLERHVEQTRLRHDAEERLLLAAWYNRGIHQTRELVERRILERQTQPTGPSNHQDRVRSDTSAGDISFLERQRELHLKPPRGLTSMVMASK